MLQKKKNYVTIRPTISWFTGECFKWSCRKAEKCGEQKEQMTMNIFINVQRELMREHGSIYNSKYVNLV